MEINPKMLEKLFVDQRLLKSYRCRIDGRNSMRKIGSLFSSNDIIIIFIIFAPIY